MRMTSAEKKKEKKKKKKHSFLFTPSRSLKHSSHFLFFFPKKMYVEIERLNVRVSSKAFN